MKEILLAIVSLHILFSIGFAQNFSVGIAQDSLKEKNRVSIGYGYGNLNYALPNSNKGVSETVTATGPVYLKYFRRVSGRL